MFVRTQSTAGGLTNKVNRLRLAVLADELWIGEGVELVGTQPSPTPLRNSTPRSHKILPRETSAAARASERHARGPTRTQWEKCPLFDS